MKESITLSPPNSLILVMDYSIGELPLPQAISGKLVAFTDSCVAVGTLSETDGPTTVTLASDLDGIEVGELIFDGVLSTPRQELSICNTKNEKLLVLPIDGHDARVRIFANDLHEPDDVVVLAQPA